MIGFLNWCRTVFVAAVSNTLWLCRCSSVVGVMQIIKFSFRFFNVLNIQNEELGKVDTVNVGDTVLVANADELSDYIAIVDALYDYGV